MLPESVRTPVTRSASPTTSRDGLAFPDLDAEAFARAPVGVQHRIVVADRVVSDHGADGWLAAIEHGERTAKSGTGAHLRRAHPERAEHRQE